MDCWEILSIEATTDRVSIKRAYAKQLKLIDLDQESQRFILLRQAFEQALRHAQHIAKQQSQHQRTQSSHDLQQEHEHEHEHPFQALDEKFSTQSNAHDLELADDSTTQACAQDALAHLNEEELMGEHITEQMTTEKISNHSCNHAQSNIVFKSRIDQLTQKLWAQQLDDETYLEFEQLCTQLYEYNLSSQLYFKAQILPVLTDIETHPLEPSYMRFLVRWYQRYPEDVIDYSEDDTQQRLQQKVILCLHHRALWRNIPEAQRARVKKLSGEQLFQPWDMLRLQYALVQYLGFGAVLQQLLYLQLDEIDRNPNYLYLKSLNRWYISFWAILVFGLNSFFVLSYLNVTLWLSVPISFLLALLYLPLIQAPLQAIICARRLQDQFLENLSIVWFISGLAILASTALVQPIWHLALSYVWLLLSLILLSSLQLTALPYMNALLQSDFYETDRWVMLIGCLGVILIASSAFYLLGRPDYPWIINYSLISLGLFFLPDSLTGLAQRCSQPILATFLNFKTTILRSLSVLLLRFGLVFILVLIFSTGANKVFLLLACLSYATLFLAMLQARWLSSSLKYVSYAVLSVLSLPTLFFPMYLIYYATQSYKHRQKIMDI